MAKSALSSIEGIFKPASESSTFIEILTRQKRKLQDLSLSSNGDVVYKDDGTKNVHNNHTGNLIVLSFVLLFSCLC